MTEVVIVDAVRTPIGRRNGGLSTVHPADLLGHGLGIEAHGHARADDSERHGNRAEESEIADEAGRHLAGGARGITGGRHGEGP